MNYLAYYLFLLLVVWGGVLYRASGPWQYVSSIAAVIAGVIFVRGRFWTLLAFLVCVGSAYGQTLSTCTPAASGPGSTCLTISWTCDFWDEPHVYYNDHWENVQRGYGGTATTCVPSDQTCTIAYQNHISGVTWGPVTTYTVQPSAGKDRQLYVVPTTNGGSFSMDCPQPSCPEGTYRNQITCTKSVNGHSYTVAVGGDLCVNGQWVAQSGDCNSACPPGMPVFVDTYCINGDGVPTAAGWLRCVNGQMVHEFSLEGCSGRDLFQHYDGDGITVPSPIPGATTLPANSLGSGGAVTPPTVNNNGTTATPPTSAGTITPVLARPATSTVNIGNLPEVANAVGAGVKEAMGGGLGSLTVSVVVSNTCSGTDTNVPAFSGIGGSITTNDYNWAGLESALSNNMAQVGEMWRSVTGVSAILDMVQSMPASGSGGDLDIGSAMHLGASYSFRSSSMYTTMSGISKTISAVFFTMCALAGLWITAIRN